ncbi:RPM1-interacting protein 4 [Abeliophyllum distichum]|uniref:RPM1-interacting protein 4 n=1 Tax=Abeliophyllum distichum TaxID=126358 RepID=A0ABD1Q507_9LAMI
MANSNVPKFGNWESEDNVPYTVYFEKARKNRGGKMINPNDPEENPDMFPNTESPAPAPAPAPAPLSKPQTRPGEQRVSREEGDFRQFRNSPAQSENMGQRTANESNYVSRGVRSGGHARPSSGSEHSIERSPLHPHHQAKITGRGSGSPAWEGKNSYDSSHGTPGRSRLKSVAQGDESPDRGAAVPKFGEWDENDPQSAENFTHIFNQVRDERNNGAGNVSGTPKHSSHGAQNQHSKNHKTRCFPWC